MKNSFNSATPNGPSKTVTDVRLTPPAIINAIGLSTLDPCGWLPNEGKPISPTAHEYFTEETDGLNLDWGAKDVFVNFPYSKAKEWMDKCSKHANGIVLCFNRSDTRWFQNNVKNATGMLLIAKRISFLNARGETQSNGNAPSILIAWGEEHYKRIKKVPGIAVRIDHES